MAVPALGALAGAVSGGLFAGGLHAIAGKNAKTVFSRWYNADLLNYSNKLASFRRFIRIRFVCPMYVTGPDHLAALLPRCCGHPWYKAGRVGALWGMGHGVSATIIGVLAFGLKSTLNSYGQGSALKKFLSGASHVTEIAVGLSLVLIGVMGIREAREWEEDIDGVQPQSLSSAAADAGIKTVQKRAVIFNGLLHGFSWDGAPSLAPAIAVATWSGSLAFLSAYAVGTMTAMTIVTTLIGEGTRRAGQFFERPDIPQKLSFFSSLLAIAIGVVWCGLAFV